MNVPLTPRIATVKDKTLRMSLMRIYRDLARVINGRLYHGDPFSQTKGLPGNIDQVWPNPNVAIPGGYPVTTPGVANTEFTITHNLGRIPIGYDIKGIDQAAIVYDSRRNAWTKTQMFLKCNVATVNLYIAVH